MGICSGFDQIFSSATIDCFEQLVNFHPSLLPYYRGPVPSYWCLKNEEQETGYTLHRLTPQIDAGAILFQERIAITTGDTEQSLDQKIAKKASALLLPWLQHVVQKEYWKPVVLEASKIYRHLVDYRSFAPASSQ